VLYDCVTQDQVEEEKSASSAKELSISRSVEEVLISSAEILSASRSA
jgi:hypothetical protein